jgi:hypothetical protein
LDSIQNYKILYDANIDFTEGNSPMASRQISRKHHFSKIPVLSNQRLVLKEISLPDVPSIIEICVYNGVFATNESDAIDILKKINADVANGDSIHWGIFLKNTNELVGTCGYYRGYNKLPTNIT